MKVLIWDFDGTLGYRDGGKWSGTLQEILRDERPDLEAPAEVLRKHVGVGYPWHTPEVPHPHLDTSDAWWDALMPVLARALTGVGVPTDEAAELVRQFPARYTDLARWRLYPDTIETLYCLAADGWQHILLTNHVPELPQIIDHLRLAPHLMAVFNSAQTGYEKPHPHAFHMVLDSIDTPEAVWMIGDNPEADIAGAEAVGIPAILVRTTSPDASRCCADLSTLSSWLPPP